MMPPPPPPLPKDFLFSRKQTVTGGGHTFAFSLPPRARVRREFKHFQVKNCRGQLGKWETCV